MSDASWLVPVACVGWGLAGYFARRAWHLSRSFVPLQIRNTELRVQNDDLTQAIIAQGLKIQELQERPVITNASGKTQMASVVLPKQIGDCL